MPFPAKPQMTKTVWRSPLVDPNDHELMACLGESRQWWFRMHIRKPDVKEVVIVLPEPVSAGVDDISKMAESMDVPWDEEHVEPGPHFKALRSRPIYSNQSLVWNVDHDSTGGKPVVIDDSLEIDEMST